MLENVDLIAVIIDRDANLTFCNDFLLRITGWKREEVLGHGWFEKFVPDTQTEQAEFTFENINRGNVPRHFEGTIKTKAGEIREIAWNNTVLNDSDSALIGVASIGDDMTDRRRAQAQLLRAQRLESVGTLAGGIAHDLNNVLTPILMGSQILAESILKPEDRSLLETIESSARRGADLVQQILLFARGTDGQPRPLDVASVIGDVYKIIRDTFPRNVRIIADAKPDLAHVKADPTQLYQVLMNLCVNARDAMPSGGTLRIDAENLTVFEQYAQGRPGAKPGTYVALMISDTGSGIPAGIIDRIFDPFFTTKEIGKGTGLGLSTLIGIVNSCQGFVTVYSEENHGTTFRVHLPALDIVGSSSKPQESEVHDGHDELILVIDDEGALREITRSTLEGHGYRVLTAQDGAQGVTVYRERNVEISAVITDMLMPVMDGSATIKALKKENPAVRILAVSGLADTRIPVTSDKGVHFLQKPYAALDLLRALTKILA